MLEEALAPSRFDVVHFHNISLVGGPGVLAFGGPAVKLATLHEHWLLCPTHVFWKEKRKLCDEKTCFTCQIRSGRPPQLWRLGSFLRDSLEQLDLMLAPSHFTMERHRTEGITRPMLKKIKRAANRPSSLFESPSASAESSSRSTMRKMNSR